MSQANITIRESQVGCKPNPGMYGIFFEEINHAGEGGIYAELVRNRSFMDARIPEGTTYYDGRVRTPNQHEESFPLDDLLPGWETIPGGEGRMEPWYHDPRNPKVPNQMKLTVSAEGFGVRNTGFWGMGIAPGGYRLTLIARTEGIESIEASIEAGDGRILSSTVISGFKGEFTKQVVEIACEEACADGALVLRPQGMGTVYFDYVSLFPKDTFRGRENGLRRDLAEKLEALHPAFVRFPGGCIVEGITLENAFRFEQTIGPVEDREGCWNLWGYRRSDGLGYHEYLELCEDLGAAGMYVCNCGMSCQARQAELGDDRQIAAFLDDAVNAISYALSPVGTKWGDERAKNGHPKPFPLQYIEIGNENSGLHYQKCYQIFYRKLKLLFPDLIYIIDDPNEVSEEQYDLVDEHFYCTPHFFPSIFHRYDGYDRNRQVYVGEYAANDQVGIGNLAGAASEACFMLGMEKNGDVVQLASYAPLLCNVNDRRWPVNLINFDSTRNFALPSYYVQKLFEEVLPEQMVACEAEAVSFTGAEQVFANAGKKDGKLIVKAVNCGPEPCEAQFALERSYRSAEVRMVCGDSPKEENSLDEPERIHVTTASLPVEGKSFTYTLKPYGTYVFCID